MKTQANHNNDNNDSRRLRRQHDTEVKWRDHLICWDDYQDLIRQLTIEHHSFHCCRSRYNCPIDGWLAASSDYRCYLSPDYCCCQQVSSVIFSETRQDLLLHLQNLRYWLYWKLKVKSGLVFFNRQDESSGWGQVGSAWPDWVRARTGGLKLIILLWKKKQGGTENSRGGKETKELTPQSTEWPVSN